MKINPKKDRFQAFPAGAYEGILNSLTVGDSRFEPDEGEEQEEAIIADISFSYVNSDGEQVDGSRTEEFTRGVLDLLRGLSPNGEAKWVDKLPTDDEGNLEIPTDSDDNVLINGQIADGWDVIFHMTSRRREGRTYNRIGRLRLAARA